MQHYCCCNPVDAMNTKMMLDFPEKECKSKLKIVLDTDKRESKDKSEVSGDFQYKKNNSEMPHVNFQFQCCKFDMMDDGRLHILPQTLLKRLISFVKENPGFFAQQIIREGFKRIRSPTKEMSSNKDENESAPSLFKEFAGYFSETEHQEIKEDTKKGKARKKKKEKRLRKKMNQKGSLEADVDERDGAQRRWKEKKQRPNYFVAVQIIEPQIRTKFVEVQGKIREKSEVNYESAFVGVEKSHITLMVMHLPDADMVEKAKLSLERCVPELQEKMSNNALKLDIEGISAFNGGRVVFACVKPSQELNFLADEVRRQMKAESITSTDSPSRSFNPHLTIMKFQGKTREKVKPELYSSFAEESFGTQEIKSIQLCRMDKKREDGYYMVDHEVFFGDSD